MRNNLRIYHTILGRFRKWFADERITRLRNLALLMTGMYLARKVHLSLITDEWHVAGRDPSLVNRLRRFLSNYRVSVRDYYRPVAESLLSSFRGLPIRLIIDTTKIGFSARLLMVSIAYRGRALPLAWSVHRGKKGWLAVEKQLALLKDEGWHYVLRQQGKIMVWWAGHDQVKFSDLDLQEGETRWLGWVYLTREYHYGPVSAVLHWEAGEDEPWYLVTDAEASRATIKTYKLRMWIEEMYGDMKGHGFDLEATHMRDLDRLSRLVLGVCLVYAWLISLGSWVIKNGKRHWVDKKSRRDKSYFRIGWSWLKRCLSQGQSLKLRFAPYAPK